MLAPVDLDEFAAVLHEMLRLLTCSEGSEKFCESSQDKKSQT